MIDLQLDQEQVNQDAEMMSQELETPTTEVPQPIPGSETAGLTSTFSRRIAREFLRDQEEMITQRSQKLEETKLEDLDPEEPYQINFDTINDTDDIKKTFGVLNEQNRNAIQTQRREVVPDEELRTLAFDLSSDPETIKTVLGLKPGEILAPEYILSMKQVLTQSANKLRDMSKMITEGTASDADKMSFHKQWEFHSQFTKQFMGVRAEYGRGLRAMGVHEGDAPVNELNDVMERFSAGHMDTNIMAEQLLRAEDTASITRVVKAQSDGKIQRVSNAFSELYISSILSGVQTHIVNSVSSAIRTASMPIDTAVAALFKADGDDVIVSGEATARLKGMMEANIEAMQTAWKVLKTGEAYGDASKMDVDYVKAISAEAFGIQEGLYADFVDAAGKVIRFPTDNLMGAEDAFFKVLNERGAIRQIAHRKAVTQGLTGEEYNDFITNFMNSPSSDALADAREAGLRGTFQQELGSAGKSVQKMRNNLWGGKFIMPFVKTPINLIYEGFVERTPIALASKKYKDALINGGKDAQMAKAKLAVGTAINSTMIGTFAALEYGNSSNDFEIIGSYPSDFKLAQAMKDAGVKENSIAYTDDTGTRQYMSFDRLEPFNSLLKLYANVMQVQKIANINDLDPDAERELNKVAAGMTLAFSEATVNQTFMRGVKDFMEALTAGNSISKIERLAANYTNAIIPYSGALRSITRTFDEQVKDADGILDKVSRSLPYVGKDNPPVLDNYGNPILVENNLTPAYAKMVQKGSKDYVRNEVLRVTEATKTVPIFKPKKNFGGYRMTAQEYYDYVNYATKDKINGRNLYEDIKNTMSMEEYKRSNDHIKALYLRTVRDAHYDYGKIKLFEKYPKIRKYDMDKKEFNLNLLRGGN